MLLKSEIDFIHFCAGLTVNYHAKVRHWASFHV